MTSRPTFLRRAAGGAVMVESLIAIPLLLFFFAMIVQMAYVSIASVIVQHSAVVAARSASVIIPDEPTAFSDGSEVGSSGGDRLATIEDAARFPLKALQPLPMQHSGFDPSTLKVKLEGAEGDSFSSEGVVRAYVTFPYQCEVMFGGSLICGTKGTLSLTAVAAMPIQGAKYEYE
jgi:hypothetical protein